VYIFGLTKQCIISVAQIRITSRRSPFTFLCLLPLPKIETNVSNIIYLTYCDMTPKMQNFGFRSMTQKCPLLHSSLLKHISAATNTHSTVEKLLGSVFSNPSVTKLYKENPKGPKPELLNTETLGRVSVIEAVTKQLVHEDMAD
jgi:hypothetical protein